MQLSRIRLIIQHLSFILLTYGGRFGLYLSPALPCFSCPFVTGCGGHCYLMGLQGFIGFGLGAKMFGSAGFRVLGYFALFVTLVALLGKTWCGWICPFGLVQDWLAVLRKKLGVRKSRIAPQVMARLGWIKYALLISLAIIPVLVSVGIVHPDFELPFCSICPAKAIMPLFAGDSRYLSLDMTNAITIGFSALLLIITGIAVTGSFFRDRFFCIFCPLLALIHILKPLNALRLVKSPQSCTGCGSCRRVCPMDIEAVFREKEKCDVQAADCLNCGNCVENCAADKALSLKWLGLKLAVSSRLRALGLKRKKS